MINGFVSQLLLDRNYQWGHSTWTKSRLSWPSHTRKSVKSMRSRLFGNLSGSHLSMSELAISRQLG